MAGTDAFGTSLSRGDGAEPEVFDPIPNLTSITGPGQSAETMDVTAHDSPDGFMEFVGGLKDGGEVSAEAHYDATSHSVLEGDLADTVNYEIALPTGDKWAVALILTNFEVDNPYDGSSALSLTWKITGKPTFTAAA